MDVALVAGCGAGGLAVGGVLDTLSGRIVRRPEPAADAVSERSLVPALAHGAPVATSSVPPPPAEPIGARVPGATELALSALLTAVAFALSAARLGAAPELAAYCSLFAGLVAIAIVDARLGIVPRLILYPTLVATGLGLLGASASAHHWQLFLDAAIGGVGAFAVFFALWWFFPRGIGFGDVRLAGVLGGALGWVGFGPLYVGFLAAFALGAVVGLVLMVRHGTGRRTRLAFAPPLALGAFLGVLWGPWAVHAWLHHG